MVRNPILDDPAVQIEKHELAQFRAEEGRFPKDGELAEWRARNLDAARARRAQEDATRAKEQAQEDARRAKEHARTERIRAAREAVIKRRMATRMQRPENYVPPTSVDEVIRRIAAGESYFEEAKLPDRRYDRFNEANRPDAVDFEACNFANASFANFAFTPDFNVKDALFHGADISRCQFHIGSNCTGADFSNVSFDKTAFYKGAIVTGASFEGAHLGYACSIQFDYNRVLHGDVRNASSEWNKLWKAFTGIQQFLNISLGIGYFGLLLTKIFLFSALGTLQKVALENPAFAQANAQLKLLQDGIPVWQMVFGGASQSYYSFGVAAVILIYQILRYRLTRQIGPMIEDQRADGRTPRLRDYVGLMKSYRRAQILGFVAVGVFSIDLYLALTDIVFPINFARS
jgi:hypothetical protein